MDPNPVSGSGSAASADLGDPRLVQKIVDELKEAGIFDQIRNECLAEVDTKVGSPISHCTPPFKNQLR
jgi:hypothetical protein